MDWDDIRSTPIQDEKELIRRIHERDWADNEYMRQCSLCKEFDWTMSMVTKHDQVYTISDMKLVKIAKQHWYHPDCLKWQERVNG